MSELDTYSQLKQRVQDFCEEDSAEFLTQLDTFIDIAELELRRDLKIDAYIRHSVATLTPGLAFIDMPSDFIDMLDLHFINGLGNRVPLHQRKDDWVTDYWPNRNETGIPKYYAKWDHDTILIAPTPDSPYALEMSYRCRLLALSASNETNWLTENAGDALLYASLVAAEMFLKADARSINWKALYTEAVARVNEEAGKARRDERLTGEPDGG